MFAPAPTPAPAPKKAPEPVVEKYLHANPIDSPVTNYLLGHQNRRRPKSKLSPPQLSQKNLSPNLRLSNLPKRSNLSNPFQSNLLSSMNLKSLPHQRTSLLKTTLTNCQMSRTLHQLQLLLVLLLVPGTHEAVLVALLHTLHCNKLNHKQFVHLQVDSRRRH